LTIAKGIANQIRRFWFRAVPLESSHGRSKNLYFDRSALRPSRACSRLAICRSLSLTIATMPGSTDVQASRLKRLLNAIGIGLGGAGVVICIAGIVVVWIASSRLNRLTESVFAKIDQAMVVVHQRVAQARNRVAEAKISTADLQESLRDWAQRAASQRLALESNAAEKCERLTTTLQQADRWLEIAESSAGLVQGLLSVETLTSAPSDSTLLSPLIAEIGSLRGQLASATEAAMTIRDRIVVTGDEKSVGERVERALQLALRVVATLEPLSSRFDAFATRLSATRSQLQEFKAGTDLWTLRIAIALTLFILLMAAGQVALCRLAWNGWSCTKSSSASDAVP
jgi:hypothetical protein